MYISLNKANAECVVELLLRSMNVKYNSRTISQNLQDHPGYPSLLSISDCLTDLKINNNTYRIARKD